MVEEAVLDAEPAVVLEAHAGVAAEIDLGRLGERLASRAVERRRRVRSMPNTLVPACAAFGSPPRPSGAPTSHSSRRPGSRRASSRRCRSRSRRTRWPRPGRRRTRRTGRRGCSGYVIVEPSESVTVTLYWTTVPSGCVGIVALERVAARRQRDLRRRRAAARLPVERPPAIDARARAGPRCRRASRSPRSLKPSRVGRGDAERDGRIGEAVRAERRVDLALVRRAVGEVAVIVVGEQRLGVASTGCPTRAG